MRSKAVLLLLLVATGGWTWDVLRAPDPDVDKGNGAFKEGRYAEALDHYRAAEADRGSTPRLEFDKGTALYKLGEQATDPAEKQKLMEQAEQAFERAADTDDPRMKSNAYHNLGNTHYQRQRWDDAIDKFRRALRADPQNDAARHNLEMALRQKPKNDQQQQQQQQQQGQQGQQGQQQQQPQGQQPPQQGQQGQQGQQPDQQQGQQPDQQQGQGQGQQQPQPGQDPTQGGQQGQPPPDQQQGQGQDPGDQQQQGQQGQGSKDPQQGQRPDGQDPPGDAESDAPTDEEQKLEALEKRSRDLRRRLLRKGSRTRDPLRLPSRKDW
jgi:Ca-activated chloride channel family protein